MHKSSTEIKVQKFGTEIKGKKPKYINEGAEAKAQFLGHLSGHGERVSEGRPAPPLLALQALPHAGGGLGAGELLLHPPQTLRALAGPLRAAAITNHQPTDSVKSKIRYSYLAKTWPSCNL